MFSKSLNGKSHVKEVSHKYTGADFCGGEINHEKIYVSNLYKHPTLDNRPLNDVEVKEGWKELNFEIEFIKPIIIVALGSQTKKQFGVKEGELKDWKEYKVFGLQHPSYINRNQTLKVEYINKLKKVKQIYGTNKKTI